MDKNTLRKLAGLPVVKENSNLSLNANFMARMDEKFEEAGEAFKTIETLINSSDFEKFINAHKHLHKTDIENGAVSEFAANLDDCWESFKELIIHIKEGDQ
jgi:hypothetical protein